MIPNNFSDYYKIITDTELLDILKHQENYQPLAVEAAKKEFENRQLSEEDINKAKEPLIAKQQEEEKQKKKIKAIKSKIKRAGNSFAEIINPIQTETLSTDKLIKIISLVFFGFLLFQIISDFKMLSAIIKDIAYFDMSSFFYFFPLIVLLLTIITFWRRKTIGWMLLTFFIIYSVMGIIWILFESFSWKPLGTPLDNIFPRLSPIVYIIQILFLVATLYFICKPNIREVFKINKQRQIATLFMSALITLFLILVAF